MACFPLGRTAGQKTHELLYNNPGFPARGAPSGPAARAAAPRHHQAPKGKQTMPTHTIRLHRVLRAPPERIYRAFLDAGALAKWLPPHGFTCTVHQLDATVGGAYRMSFTNFSTGHGHSFGGKYLELVPNQRLRHTDEFDDPNLPGEMVTTVALKQVSCGTEVSIVQEGVPAVVPPEACYLGWQDSLAQLGLLVEAVVPE